MSPSAALAMCSRNSETTASAAFVSCPTAQALTNEARSKGTVRRNHNISLLPGRLTLHMSAAGAEARSYGGLSLMRRSTRSLGARSLGAVPESLLYRRGKEQPERV